MLQFQNFLSEFFTSGEYTFHYISTSQYMVTVVHLGVSYLELTQLCRHFPAPDPDGH